MKATKEQKETLNNLISELKSAHGMRDSYEEINSLIQQFEVFASMVEVEE